MRTPEQDHASLEVELHKLEERYSWDDAPAAVKRRMRTIKNRLSAKKSREQAREYVDKLERSVRLLSDESDLLARRLAIVEAENKILQQVDDRRQSLAARSHGDNDDTNNSDNFTTTHARAIAPPASTVSNEEEGQDEPAVPSKPSLQLDALLFLLQTVAASRESCPSTPSPKPGGGPQTPGSARAPGLLTSRLLRLRAKLSKQLTKKKLSDSVLRSGKGQKAAASPKAKAMARRARVLRVLRVTRSLQRWQRASVPQATPSGGAAAEMVDA
uniref:BZIP domain-containing protein n=1 Tax=Hemiselmis andersenii TaxID=464988 RepID=A0A6T8JE43_HEMAN|mmetsp:Transcript_25377/g.58800  ORF Transcript_25377/g.58800 Transcript_25377/m.58800 type:complete len:272 (+) Transcript_25377:192-1007(+)